MASSAATVPVYRLSVADVMGMVQADVLDEDARVELVEGVLVEMVPIGAEHDGAVRWLTRRFNAVADPPWELVIQSTFLVGDGFVVPDLLLVEPLPRDRQPTTALLATEVAQTSQARDREKATAYAAAGVPEYWIVDLAARELVVHREPRAGAYRSVETFMDGATVTPLAQGAPAVDVTALLG